MELDLAPETQARLNELAQRTHRGTDELLAEAVDHLVACNDWLGRKGGDSMAAAGRGETVPTKTCAHGSSKGNASEGCASSGRSMRLRISNRSPNISGGTEVWRPPTGFRASSMTPSRACGPCRTGVAPGASTILANS